MLIAMGLVFVLLLGEIDLSAGVAGGVCAAIMALMLIDYDWSWWIATARRHRRRRGHRRSRSARWWPGSASRRSW